MHPFYLLSVLFLSSAAYAEPTTIIHILNWHYISRDDFAADLRSSTGKPLTDDQIDKEYLSFLDDVKVICLV